MHLFLCRFTVSTEVKHQVSTSSAVKMYPWADSLNESSSCLRMQKPPNEQAKNPTDLKPSRCSLFAWSWEKAFQWAGPAVIPHSFPFEWSAVFQTCLNNKKKLFCSYHPLFNNNALDWMKKHCDPCAFGLLLQYTVASWEENRIHSSRDITSV